MEESIFCELPGINAAMESRHAAAIAASVDQASKEPVSLLRRRLTPIWSINLPCSAAEAARDDKSGANG